MSSLEVIPDSILAEAPVAKPPQGVISNFVNPPTSGTQFIIYGGVIVPIMLGFFAIRVYSRLQVIRRLSWDDLTCSIATVGTVLYYICVTLAITKGKYGRHAWDTSVLDTTRPGFAVPVYIINWLATLILPLAKLTFLIFYLQIFRPFRWLRILCYIGVAFTTVTFLSFFVAQMALETPHPGESWLQMDEDPRELKSLHYLSIPITAASFGIDIYVFVLPMMGVAKLKLSPRRRFGVVVVFLTGFTACIASFLSLYYKIRLNSSTDVIWASMPVDITILTEMCVGVTASCMPSLANIVRHYFPNFSMVRSLVSLKAFLLTGRHGESSNATPSASSSHNHIVQEPSFSESNKNLKKSAASFDAHNLELGNVSQVTTRVDGSNMVEMHHLNGIQVQRALEQTSQKTDKELKK